MEEDNNIKQLIEMGFTPEVAQNALQSRNNNLEQAIGYLLGESTVPPPPPPPQHHYDLSKENMQLVPYEDTIDISNPDDIPTFIEHINESRLTSRLDFGVDDYQQFETDMLEASQTIFSHPKTFERTELAPPAILPKSSRFAQNYLIPILMIMYQLKEVRLIILNKTDFDYGYEENWYNNDTDLVVDVPEEFKEVESSYRFVIEIQRLFGFLTPLLSKRAFISAESLFKSIPTQFFNELISEIDDTDELIRRLYEFMNEEVEKILGSEAGTLGSLTTSYVKLEENIPDVDDDDEDEEVEDQVVDLCLFQIDSDRRETTIMESFNNLFWGPGVGIGKLSFAKLSPMLTIHFQGDDEGLQVEPIQLQEHFYPGVYSSEYSSLVKDMSERRAQVTHDRKLTTSKLMELSSFEGKRIKKVIHNAVGYLQSLPNETQAFEDLKRLSENIQNESDLLNLRISTLNQDYSSLDIMNHDNILKKISMDPKLSMPEKYILVGIVLSDSEYYYKSKNYTKADEDWVHVVTVSDNKRVKDYCMETTDFEGVQVSMKEETKNSAKLFILFYAKESSFNEEIELPISDRLKDFFDKDNEYLSEEIKPHGDIINIDSGDESLEYSSYEEDEVSSKEGDNNERDNKEEEQMLVDI